MLHGAAEDCPSRRVEGEETGEVLLFGGALWCGVVLYSVILTLARVLSLSLSLPLFFWKVLIPWMDFFISQLGWISTIARTEWSTEDLIRVRVNRLLC